MNEQIQELIRKGELWKILGNPKRSFKKKMKSKKLVEVKNRKKSS